MSHKWIIRGLLCLLTIFLFIAINKAQYYEGNDLTVITEKHLLANAAIFRQNELLARDKITAEFKAGVNNLGIISVKFNTYKRLNDDYLIFRIKEKGAKSWYYENKYKTDQFVPDDYFPFGFPPIENSKNKVYQIEIESSAGIKGDAVSLSRQTDYFLSKYNYPKELLMSHKLIIASFVFYKVISYLELFSIIDLFLIVIASFLTTFIFFVVTKKAKIIFFLIKKVYPYLIKIFKFLKTILYIKLIKSPADKSSTNKYFSIKDVNYLLLYFNIAIISAIIVLSILLKYITFSYAANRYFLIYEIGVIAVFILVFFIGLIPKKFILRLSLPIIVAASLINISLLLLLLNYHYISSKYLQAFMFAAITSILIDVIKFRRRLSIIMIITNVIFIFCILSYFILNITSESLPQTLLIIFCSLLVSLIVLF